MPTKAPAIYTSLYHSLFQKSILLRPLFSANMPVFSVLNFCQLLPKGTPFGRSSFFDCIRFERSGFVPESGKGHIALLRSCRCGYFSTFPPSVYILEIRRQRLWRSSKTHASGFCRRDPLCLALPDIGTLILGHKRKHLKDNIA